jgi:hypothetical protein
VGFIRIASRATICSWQERLPRTTNHRVLDFFRGRTREPGMARGSWHMSKSRFAGIVVLVVLAIGLTTLRGASAGHAGAAAPAPQAVPAADTAAAPSAAVATAPEMGTYETPRRGCVPIGEPLECR